jgi:hypothetical protein
MTSNFAFLQSSLKFLIIIDRMLLVQEKGGDEWQRSNQLMDHIEGNLKVIFCLFVMEPRGSNTTVAVFLVICDPPMNELWAT